MKIAEAAHFIGPELVQKSGSVSVVLRPFAIVQSEGCKTMFL